MKLIYLVVCYLVGGISPSSILAKRRGVDIHESGTKNAGATNAMFLFGWRAGIAVMLLDIAKALLCVRLARLLWHDAEWLFIAAGAACMVGHIFPIYYRFKGGKGTACLGGIIVGLTPELFMPMLLAVTAIGLIFNHASVLPIIAVSAYPLLYGMCTASVSGAIMLAGLLPLMLWAHRNNFRKKNREEEPGFRDVLLHKSLSSYTDSR